MKRKAIALIPAYTHIDWRLLAVLKEVGLTVLDVHGSSDLVRTRSRLLSRALSCDADRFVFIDSDIIPTARDLVELVESPMLDAENAVSGCYVVRETTLASQPEADSVELFGRERFVPMFLGGMGFAAVHRAPIEKIRAQLPRLDDATAGQWYPFFLPLVVSEEDHHEYLADDYSFWWRVRLTGTKLWLDTHLVVGHVKKSIWLPKEGVPGENYSFARPPQGPRDQGNGRPFRWRDSPRSP